MPHNDNTSNFIISVNKYKEEREDDDKLSKLTMHSFKKKTKRISMRIGNYVGLASQVRLSNDPAIKLTPHTSHYNNPAS